MTGLRVQNVKGKARLLKNWIAGFSSIHADSPQADRHSQTLSIIPIPSRASRHKFGRKQIEGRRRLTVTVTDRQFVPPSLLTTQSGSRRRSGKGIEVLGRGRRPRRAGRFPLPHNSQFTVHSSETGIGFMTEPSLEIEMK